MLTSYTNSSKGSLIELEHGNFTANPFRDINNIDNKLKSLQSRVTADGEDLTGKFSEELPRGDAKLNNSSELNQLSKKIMKKKSGEDNGMRHIRSRKTWSLQEDQYLIEQVKIHGLNWALISHNMGRSRTGKQIRDRYLNKLHPSIVNSKWTDYEDQQLLLLFRSHGRRWCEIAKYLPGRTEIMVKNRFYSKFKEHLSEKIQTAGIKKQEKPQQEISGGSRESVAPSTASSNQETKDLHDVDKPSNFQNLILPNDLPSVIYPDQVFISKNISSNIIRVPSDSVATFQSCPLKTAVNRSSVNQKEEVSFIDFSLPNKNNYDLLEGIGSFNTNNNDMPAEQEVFKSGNFDQEIERQGFSEVQMIGGQPENHPLPSQKELRLRMLISRLTNVRNLYMETIKEINEIIENQ